MTTHTTHHVAVIDLGSNTCRLVVFSAAPGYAFRLEDQIREVVRLRQGLTKNGLAPSAVERALFTLRLFKRFCDSYPVVQILAAGTSAVRDAADGEAFVRRVRREVGLDVRILSGEEEAYYGALGALNEAPVQEGVVLDIGGGSAQLSQIQRRRFVRGLALGLGALQLTERFVRSDPPSAEDLAAVQAEIDAQLDGVGWLTAVGDGCLVGVGGTIRNLARIEMARLKSPLSTLHGAVLSLDGLQETIDRLRALPLGKRERLLGLNSDRADIILAGALVVRTVMQRLGVVAMRVSEGGLREGLFYEQFWGHLPSPIIPDVRRFGVLNLARNYRYHKRHANHVRFLALRLFAQLQGLHGRGTAEQELLDAAALLHDLGTVIGYEGHHRHSQTLIEYNGLPGFTSREISLIALLTRYHRKGVPSVNGYDVFLGSEDDRRLLLQLSAILRMAEFLERGRNSAVDDLLASWTDQELTLTVVADEYPAVELWEAQRQALPLFELAFGRTVQLHSLATPHDWLKVG